MESQKTLSQKEIDALLSILPNDNVVSPETNRFLGSARIYDFRSPDKFSKEQLRTLQMIHENFARRVSSSLAAYLRAVAQLTHVHIEQGSFADFMQNIPPFSLAAVLKMNPLPGRALLTLDSATTTIAIDRLLGGFGRPVNDEREVTDIEQSLIQGLIKYLADGLREAWQNVIELEITIEETTLSTDFIQVALPADAAIFLGFEIKIRDSIGAMSICLPYSVLKPILSELSPHTWVSGGTGREGVHHQELLKHLKHIDIDLTVLLGGAVVDFNELLHLQKGDVLVLDTMIDRYLTVLVGESEKYLGQPGLRGRNMAVQITEALKGN